MIFAWIFAIGGIVALAFVIYRLFHGDRPQQDNSAGPTSARTILDERFARGEIDENEYRQRRETLNGR
ncbi:SHOCT domain-containing protein [Cryobacterium zhongshanensis]|uniref:SHOCT domain-containing protein n=1 Tax=Cryobacterium zhongshanensis TaxID=2928153 RepID=A0AA41QXP4_9MICO|nr:SHOCT domain-containing protein [Cryobacterium zhongshanensis]MCI4658453.1 SHOCT domain-containing protein [Cryobacterium zhongshanensis]